MKLQTKTIEMTSTLTLTEHETEMLAYLAGYGPKALAELISKKLTSRYEVDAWEKFWREMRSVLESNKQRFDATRNVFIGTQQAVSPRPTDAVVRDAADTAGSIKEASWGAEG